MPSWAADSDKLKARRSAGLAAAAEFSGWLIASARCPSSPHLKIYQPSVEWLGFQPAAVSAFTPPLAFFLAYLEWNPSQLRDLSPYGESASQTQ